LGRSPPHKTWESIFFHNEFVKFGTHHSRYKDISSSIVLSQKCCEVYFISLTVTKLLWDLTTKYYWIAAPLTLLAVSVPAASSVFALTNSKKDNLFQFSHATGHFLYRRFRAVAIRPRHCYCFQTFLVLSHLYRLRGRHAIVRQANIPFVT